MLGRATKERTTSAVPLGIIALLLIFGLGVFYWVFLRTPPVRPSAAQLSDDAKGYVRFLKLSDTEMKATQNFMGSTVVELNGKIANNGSRNLKLVELNCVFTDPYGQVVLRERVPIVRDKGPTFGPGAVRDFRLPFDSVPQTWNQVMPQLVIARIDFAE